MIAYIDGKEIGLWSTPTSNKQLRVYYVQNPTDLSDDSDTIDATMEDYEDGLIAYAVMNLGEQLMGSVDIETAKILNQIITRFERRWLEYLNKVDDGGIENKEMPVLAKAYDV